MQPPLFHFVLEHAAHWRYFWFAVLVFVEGPTTTIAGAVLAATGVLDPWKVFATAVASNLAADAFWFQVGQWIRTRGHWMERVEKRYPLVRPLERKLRQRAVAFLVIAKFTLSSVPALIAAGLSHVPWRKVVGVVLIADSAWIAFLSVLGYLLWDRVAYLAVGFRAAVLIGFAIFAYLVVRWAHSALNGMLEADEEDVLG